MSSCARQGLRTRLADVDELIRAHGSVTGGRPGRPARRKGAAITRAGVVLLAAAMEAFVEDLFEEACDHVFAGLSADEKKDLFKDTSRRLNNADVRKTNLLFFNLGAPWVLKRVKWQKCSNARFQKRLNRLIEVRGQIAHGRKPAVRLQYLRGARKMVEKYAEVLEAVIAQYIGQATGKPAGW